jgi:hypothetical protein
LLPTRKAELPARAQLMCTRFDGYEDKRIALICVYPCVIHRDFRRNVAEQVVNPLRLYKIQQSLARIRSWWVQATQIRL